MEFAEFRLFPVHDPGVAHLATDFLRLFPHTWQSPSHRNLFLACSVYPSPYLLANMLQLSRSYTMHLDSLESIPSEKRSRDGFRCFMAFQSIVSSNSAYHFRLSFLPLHVYIYIYIPDISEMYLPASFPGLSHFFFSPRLLPVIYYIDDPRPIVSVTAV